MARIVRFGGATKRPESVLTHSFAVGQLVKLRGAPDTTTRKAYGHDASEGITNDIPYPWKAPEQRILEDLIQSKLFEGWGIENPTEEEYKLIKDADNDIVVAEAIFYGLKNFRQDKIERPLHGDAWICCLGAEEKFPFFSTFLNSKKWEEFANLFK